MMMMMMMMVMVIYFSFGLNSSGVYLAFYCNEEAYYFTARLRASHLSHLSCYIHFIFAYLQILDGNDDRNSVQANWMVRPFVARYLRIYPNTWNSGICLRGDGYGSPLGKLLPLVL